MKCYVDMVSSAAPPRGNEGHKVSPIRIALAVEDDDKQIVRTVVRRIIAPEDAKIDLNWCVAYGCPIGSIADAMDPVVVAAEVAAALKGVSQATAHFVGFHRKQFDDLMAPPRGGIDPILDWFCTMGRTADACRLPQRQGSGFKPPRLGEALEHYTGEGLPSADGMTWQQVALRQITAVRRVCWGYHRWGIAPEVVDVVA